MQFILANIRAFSLEFIMIIIVLMSIVFGLTYFIKRYLMNKYIKELELSKTIFNELHDELYSYNWNVISGQLEHQHELRLEFERINQTLKGCETLSDYFDENTTKKYEIKEIVNVISCINDVVELEKDNIKKLNQKVNSMLFANTDRFFNESIVSQRREIGSEKGREIESELESEIEIQKDEVTPEIEKCDRVRKTVENNNINNGFTAVNEENSECSLFAKGIVIKGDVELETPIVVKGIIQGSLMCNSDVEIDDSALINGNVTAGTLTLSSGKVEGDVNVSDKAHIGEDTFVKGNVSASVLSVNGSIEGDVVCQNEVAFSSDAKVMGNITAAYVDIEKGAKIVGTMRIGANTSDRNE